MLGIYTIYMYLWQSPGNAARRKLLTELHQQQREKELLIKSIKRNDLRYMRALKYATKVSVTLTTKTAANTEERTRDGDREEGK